MVGLVYVTSPLADHKVVNSLLLYIRDWEYGLGDQFMLVTIQDNLKIDRLLAQPDNGEGTALVATSPPLSKLANNAWTSCTIKDVESFQLTLDHQNLYVALDDQGVRDQTCILGHQVIVKDPETDTYVQAPRFEKFRLPWDQLYMTWCNLEVSNMDFEDFTRGQDREAGSNDGWYTYLNPAEGTDLSEENVKLRNAELERLKIAGLA